MLKVIFIRFTRGFVAGAVAGGLALLNSGLDVFSPNGLKAFCSALIVGGLMALDKMFRYRD